MATTKLHQIKSTESRAISYIENADKTENGSLVYSFFCSSDPAQAAKDFQMVRDTFRSKTEVLGHHIIQSFKPEEVTPEEAHRIGMELCDRLLHGDYQFILSTHTDKAHVHNHIILNNTNMTNGRSFNTLENKGQHFWLKLRNVSDELCKENGLSVVNYAEQEKGAGHYEWEMNRQGLSWKAKLKLAIDDCVQVSEDFEDFLRKCPDFGIIAEYDPIHKVDLKFKLAEHVKEKPNIKFTRAKTLGWFYEKPQIEKTIMLINHPEIYKPKMKTKIVEVGEQAGIGLRRWADIQNMKEASKVINILTEYGVNDSIELENLAIAKMAEMGSASSKLNALSTRIKDLSQAIDLIQTRKENSSVVQEWKSLSGRKKKKFEDSHYDELDSYRNATARLKELYPGHKLPSVEDLKKQKNDLVSERSKLEDFYKKVKHDVEQLNYARQATEDYRREREITQQQSKHNEKE